MGTTSPTGPRVDVEEDRRSTDSPCSPIAHVGSPDSQSAQPAVAPSEPISVGAQQLSPFQCRLLCQNWHHLNKTAGPGGIGSVIFQKFLSKNPDCRDLFQKASVVGTFSGDGSANCLQDHAKLLTDLIDQSISNLDNLAELGAVCVRYGSAHASLRETDYFNNESWDEFGQAMLRAFTQLEVVRKHKELVRAWIVLISFMIDKMRQGYVTAGRRSTLFRSQTSN